MNKYLLSFIFPQILKTVKSPINGKIIVEKTFGTNRIVVGGYWQSGNYIKKLIRTALRSIKKFPHVNKILLLGLGGGSAVEVFDDYFPKAHITGVDLDPEMVELGKKYFNLNNAKNLRIIISDAYLYVKKCIGKQKFDLIVSDLFIGCDCPKSTDAKRFVNILYEILNPEGIYISNRSYLKKYKNGTESYLKKIEEKFKKTETIFTMQNLLIIAYK